MSVLDAVRKAVQDVVAPDLKALSVRADERDKPMNLRFDHTEERFKQAEDLSRARYETMRSKLELATAVIAANHESVMRPVDLDRRMERMEFGLPSRSEEPGKS